VSKRAERRDREALFESVSLTTSSHDAEIDADVLNASGLSLAEPTGKKPLTLMKKFRFQLLSRWMAESLAPCRAADIGGGKGLLAHLLNEQGWDATVIDPVFQHLPEKYKDLESGRQVKLGESQSVRRLSQPFTED
jgi:2-polyprenyl-3-methyl-5-hydroxy-6-metoxy-1,4-benzoquinol methylase